MKTAIFIFIILWTVSLKAQNIDSLKVCADSLSFKDTLLADTLNKLVIDTNSQRILLIGDSMVGGLAYAMQDYCDYNGHKFLAVAWESAQTYWFVKTDTLKHFIKTFKPSFIFVLLGANEVYLKNYEKSRSKYIKQIIQQIDTIPFVWLGPPNWNYDTAINGVIGKIVGYNRFFETYKLSLNNPKFKRWKDRIHPALSADRLWMDSLSYWIMNKSEYKFKFYKPPYFSEKPKANLLILKPLPKKYR